MKRVNRMAVVKIKQIKRTTGKALAYIMNPAKTEDSLLISGFNVDAEVASMEFDFTAALAKNVKGDYSKVGGSDIKAYHMIQSFAKGDDLTPAKAHEIGKQWADEMLGGKHEYVIATHIDKECIHNHVIFNATSYYDFKKFESVPYKTVRQMRQISDRLCAENNLSVIRGERPARKNQKYDKVSTLRDKLVAIIDKTIANASDYEEFKALLAAEKVEIKEGKHLSFRHPEGERFLRGRNLPGDYSKEKILERISAAKNPEAAAGKDVGSQVNPTYAEELTVKSRKTKLAETQELAKALLVIRQEKVNAFTDFTVRHAQLLDHLSNAQQQVVAVEHKNKEYGDAAKYLIAYNDTLPVQQEYEDCGRLRKASFYQSHKAQLEKHAYALQRLQKMKVNPAVDPDKVIELVKNQNQAVDKLKEKLTYTEKRIDTLLFAQQVAAQIEQETAVIRNTNRRKGKSI